MQVCQSKKILRLRLVKNILGDVGEGVIEILSEDGDEGIAEELIDTDAFAAAFLVGILAYSPTMEIERLAAAGESGDAYRVEPAGLRLTELAGSLEETPLDGAEAVPVLVECGVGALLGLIHDGRHDVSVTVDGEETLPADLRAALRPHEF